MDASDATARLGPEAAAAVDDHFQGLLEPHGIPGIAYAVGARSGVVHAGGAGIRRLGAADTPGAGTASRICSMTKSFVAAALLMLRDEGRLALDETAETYVPEARALAPPVADSPPIRLRQLLTMTAGLPEDDAWGDRLMDLPAEGVDEILLRGALFARAPGTGYEYSNLGWVVLGRVVTNVCQRRAQDVIGDRILGPLGMRSTGWSIPPAEARMFGHRLRDGALVEEPQLLEDGDFAPMAGIWSTPADLVRWMGFFMDAFPPRDDADDGPLRRASRREMQHLQALEPGWHEAPGEAGGYGFGLMAAHGPLGHVVGHPGGLPGFGSYMGWLPERGIGVVALANRTYAPMRAAVRDALALLDRHGAIPQPPSPEHRHLSAACEALARLLAAWDDELADRLFAGNVFLDEDRERRRSDAELLRRELGVLQAGSVCAQSATRGSFALQGERGEATVDVMLAPALPARIEHYQVRRRSTSS